MLPRTAIQSILHDGFLYLFSSAGTTLTRRLVVSMATILPLPFPGTIPTRPSGHCALPHTIQEIF
jgi:hypothetical protein